jgi:hypothetical protein
MNDLQKIAQSDELTYLQKVASIVDAFAAGEVSGEDADAIAQEAGISPEDLLSMHTAVYGEAGEEVKAEGGDIEKTAAAEDAAEFLVKVAQDENATYLEKCAGVADAYAAGAVTAEEGDEIAQEIGLNPDDVASVYVAAYGHPGDMEKTAAAEDAVEFLVKVAEAEDSTYLEKCAAVADAYMADAVSPEEAVEIANELGIESADVDSVIEAAYGDVLEKEAGAKTDAVVEGAKTAGSYVSEKAGKLADVLGREDIKAGRSMRRSIARAKTEDGKELLRSEGNKKIALGAAKAGGAITAVGAGGYGATKLFGKKKDK